ncbi:hypothetical protein RHSIM_Rhsim11G0015200 [Rhododendron simsii]|uniref:Uncharacterized protein n=1 Tax=Rhododendron simsii TaxID=118357 RepID=A0A834LBS4_RHOSS|nr:hypothetical protein RHSIM_Rhsim11G0015200 [Rhododendron simsii]
MAEKQPMSDMEGKSDENLTPEVVMYAMSLIRHTLYKVENELRYEVHPRSCLTGISDLLMLTPADIAEFLDEFEDSWSRMEENKTPGPSKDTSENASG